MPHYKEITTIEEWNQLYGDSYDQALLIFKHSTTCPISAEAYRQFQQYLDDNPRIDLQYLLVKVIESRHVSNQIAADLNVRHESPQAILVEHKQPHWHASHRKITKQNLQNILGE
ncbi:MAG TPA: bacillithiol system redox-active protein YtxJ [Bacillota bacterium]|nr:bacillithiol system redox-active protein YtxJ [Bacillota bacterium]